MTCLKQIFLVSLSLLLADIVVAQPVNMVKIQPDDSPSVIIAKAACLRPSERQFRWQQLELTAFFHFGINTFTERQWGTGQDNISLFNPKHLDANQWVRTMKEAGFKQVILTAKHHDGFCLWPSQYTKHTIAYTPYKNGHGDIVREVALACKKYKMGLGLYLSPWDRNSPYYGDSVLYNDYFVHQLTELLTHYGRVDEVWFDGANGEGPNGKKQWYDFNRWYAVIRKLQPQAVIAIMGPDVRWVGTESGEGRQTEWSVVPIGESSQNKIAAASQKDVMVRPEIKGGESDQDLGSLNKIMHASGLIWYPAETDVSIRPGWFYDSLEDDKVKSPEALMQIYFTSVGRNSVLLLNVPPDKDGLLSVPDVNALLKWHQLLRKTFKRNLAGEAILSSSNGKGLRGLTDGNYHTYFTTTGKDTTSIITLKWSHPVEFNLLSLQENILVGQRIAHFIFESKDRQGWHVLTEGTTVGYKRLLRFKTVRSRCVRLRILSSRLNPTLAEMGVYKYTGIK